MEVRNQSNLTEQWYEAMQDMAARSDVSYWNRRAEDYDDFITTSGFDYGHSMVDILGTEGVLSRESRVLEIASGVGAVTIPLALASKTVTAVEPATAMARLLKKNASVTGVSNINVKTADFDSFAGTAADKGFDLVLLCHAAWQFPDIVHLVREMRRLSSGFCCLADTMGRGDAESREMHRRLRINPPEMDRAFHLLNIVAGLGLHPETRSIEHKMRRSENSARAMWRNLLGKYRLPDNDDLSVIDEHVASRTSNGVYESPGAMSLIWWRSR